MTVRIEVTMCRRIENTCLDETFQELGMPSMIQWEVGGVANLYGVTEVQREVREKSTHDT